MDRRSDSGSDSDYDGNWPCSRHRSNMRNDTVLALRTSEAVYDKWLAIPEETKREAVERMKICTFWLPILLQQEESNIFSWAVHIGLVDDFDPTELSLKHIHRIEIVEAVLRAMESRHVRPHAKQIICLSNMFNLRSKEVLEEALYWLEKTGEPAIRHRVMELGFPTNCYLALHLIFTEFAKCIQDLGSSYDKTMKSLMARPPEYYIEKSEEMKKRGNEYFQKSQFEDAVKFYSKAIKFYPDNHIIYGNRALCYIRCKMFLKAVGDGKRATLIKPLWAKGHYRYCEALFSLGEVKNAIEANMLAQRLCKDDHEGMRDLEQQHQKFCTELGEQKVGKPKSKFKRPNSTNRANGANSPQPPKVVQKTNISQQKKVSEIKTDKPPGKSEHAAQMKNNTKDSNPSKREVPIKNAKGETSTTSKKKVTRNGAPEEEKVAEKVDVTRELRSLVQDAYTALADLRSRNAEQAFSQALSILETNPNKECGLSSVDELLLLFGRVSALTEIGQSEELAEAKKLVAKMNLQMRTKMKERTFQCLVYYATGKVCLKENRFAAALEQFSDSLQIVENQITPGKLTWPLSKEIVKETQLDYFKEMLESSIELCRFPPLPNAVCRFEKGHGSWKAEIYLTDPDFKGYIQLGCCQSCSVEYHITCWKSLKTSTFSERNEKDILQEACLTPDCEGQICSIKIIGPTGLLKCKFEAAIPKLPTPKKPKVNQKCSSQQRMKSKAEHKLKRKQNKQSLQRTQTMYDENLQQTQDTALQSQQKAWILYRDGVLLQISQKMDLLREEKGLQVSALASCLKPWLELDALRGNQIADRLLKWQQEPLDAFSQAVELVLERKNRVWARILIQLLSSSGDLNPRVTKWACQLNNSGLDAAKTFIDRYAGHLEQLDLALLLNFAPLQEMFIMNLGAIPEFFSSNGLTVTDYLKQASPHDMRLFIWTLEEHRGDYVACHTILDEYFDMMDGNCSVLKKSDENENNSPVRSKRRKAKKGQNLRCYFRTDDTTPRDEADQDLFEDDSLSFLHPADPFTVPVHLRDQVADFEEQYNGTSHQSSYKRFLDNYPDQTTERLYDYFEQILEEHGPLVGEHPLLVGELQHFPSEALEKIQHVGGLESFLLDSLCFIKIGHCIGLAKHAVGLQQVAQGASLDDLDDILDLDTDDQDSFLTGYQPPFSSAQPELYPTLTNGHEFASEVAVAQDPVAEYFSFKDHSDLPLHEGVSSDGLFAVEPPGAGTSWTAERKHAQVQTCPEAMSSVSVNTEPCGPFESCQGDINKKEKSNFQMQQKILKLASGKKVNPKLKEEIAALEEDLRKINADTQVTQKELNLQQQKLEEEVKKDQQEKKANQEVLKSLKMEIEHLVKENGRLSKKIEEMKSDCSAQHTNFWLQENEKGAEMTTLNKEIKRLKSLCASASRRSHTAQVSVAESRRDQGVHALYKDLAEAKAFLNKLDEAMHKQPNQGLEQSRATWRANVQEIEKKISSADAQYQEQIDQVKNGRKVESSMNNVSNQPKSSAIRLTGAARGVSPQPSVQASSVPQPPPAAAAAPVASLDKRHMTDIALESLSAIFPDMPRSELLKYVRPSLFNARSNRIKSVQDIVAEASQCILDQQEQMSSAQSRPIRHGSPARGATAGTVWQPVFAQRPTIPTAINLEDPCIICHEDMKPGDISVLECRHSFHDWCIRSWLKEQSTCPTCRDHALMPDDFPMLPGRKRLAP